MDWNCVFNICAVFGALGTLVGGIIELIRFFRKPKANLSFTNGERRITFSPRCFRHISTKYYVGPINYGYDASAYQRLIERYNQQLAAKNEFVLSFRLSNTGKLQLENVHVAIDYDNGIQDIGVVPNQSLDIQQCIEPTNELHGVHIDKNMLKIEYAPLDNKPLNQKDHKDFLVRFTPNPNAEQIELNWRISAKDFYKEGKLFVNLTPRVDELDDIHFKNCERDVPEGGELIEDLMPYIQKLQRLIYN